MMLSGRRCSASSIPRIRACGCSWRPVFFLFFRPVFNIADMSITIGVLSIILFHRSFFSSQEKKEDVDKTIIEEASELADQGSETIEPQQDISKNELPT